MSYTASSEYTHKNKYLRTHNAYTHAVQLLKSIYTKKNTYAHTNAYTRAIQFLQRASSTIRFLLVCEFCFEKARNRE